MARGNLDISVIGEGTEEGAKKQDPKQLKGKGGTKKSSTRRVDVVRREKQQSEKALFGDGRARGKREEKERSGAGEVSVIQGL